MPACRVCGCDALHACVDEALGPCWWVDSDLCSHCVVKQRVVVAMLLGVLIGVAVGVLATLFVAWRLSHA